MQSGNERRLILGSMKFRTLIFILLSIAFAAGAWLTFFHDESRTSPPVVAKPQSQKPSLVAVPETTPQPIAQAPPTPAVVPPSRSSTVINPKPGALASLPENVQPEATAALDKIQLMLRDYRTLGGDNPVGTNAEITKALMGGNSKHAILGPADGQGINDQGELVDQWGTPYFFHQMSGTHMEIRSAGPDKKMWTSDDVVNR
jgi:hypothetical protein